MKFRPTDVSLPTRLRMDQSYNVVLYYGLEAEKGVPGNLAAFLTQKRNYSIGVPDILPVVP